MSSSKSGTVAALSASTDQTLTKLSRLLSTTSGLSTTLLTLNYTLTLLHSQLSSAAAKQVAQTATNLAQKASENLLPGETVIASATLPATRLASSAVGVRMLRDKISDVRTFLRLFGLLGVYQLGKATINKPESDSVLRAVQVTQLVTIASFQILENISYLTQLGVLRLQSMTPERRLKALLWSVRSWAIYLAMDFVRLYRTRQLRMERERAQRGTIAEESEKEQKIAKRKEMETFYKELTVDLGYAPLAVHWSIIGGMSWVNEFWTGFFGTMVGLAGFRAAWKNLS